MDEQRFTWVPFYRELAERFLQYSARRAELVEIIRAVYQDAGEKLENVFRNVDTQSDIDPFTLFAGFNFGNQGVECRKRICSAYRTAFSMTALIPENYDGVPMQFRDQKIFYSKNQDPSEFDILWEMFTSAYSYNEKSGDGSFIQTYGLALNTHLKKDGTINGHSQNKLTKGLFYIRPDMFISLDKNNRSLLISLKQGSLLPDKMQRLIGRVEKGDVLEPEAYLNLCKEVVAYLKNEKQETLLDFTYRAYKEAGEKTDAASDDDGTWFPALSEYNPGLTVDDWLNYLQHSGKFSQTQREYLAMMYDYGGAASCTQLAIKYHRDAPALAGIATNFAKQAQQFLNCPTRTDEEGHIRYWSIPFLGRNASSKEDGAYVYKLRPELKEALERINITQFLPSTTEEQKPMYPLNTILYGPPGTGKTYHTAIYAVAIIDEKPMDEVKQMSYDAVMARYHELRDKGQIAFATFHQSYGYEDFIEGIRPVLAEEKESDETANDVQYALKPGVFLEFCRKASVPILKNAANIGLNDNPTIWKVSLEGTGNNPTRTECMKNNHIRIGWDEYGVIPKYEEIPTGKVVLNAFYSRMKIGDIVLSCYSASSIDAIGVITGDAQWSGEFDYFNRVRNVKWLIKGLNYDITSINGGKTMTLSTVYALNSISVDDVLNIVREKAPSVLATEEKRPNYVFIIDEINRGNISKIFGELITLIESSKRAGQPESVSAILPYSQKPFSVPNNVYLVGTMNTADRSIALLDTALRRRFSFVEMMPNPNVDYLQGLEVEGLSISQMLTNMNRKIEVLYDREHTIGHAYFRPLADEQTVQKLAEIFRDRIIPLLQEYFYDDYEKIRLVLGDNKTTNTNEQFIVCNQQTTDLSDLFGETSFDLNDYQTFSTNPDAFENIESYKKI